jgi:DNA-binding ferritin-like protein
MRFDMSKSLNALGLSIRPKPDSDQRAFLVLEKQLMRTIELRRNVEQARYRSIEQLTGKVRILFDGMANELQSFSQMMVERLQSMQAQQCHTHTAGTVTLWRLFCVEKGNLHDELKSLLCSYARYGRETSEAKTSLQRLGDLESVRLLTDVQIAVDRSLWFIELYLEGLIFHTSENRLPDWSERGGAEERLALS